MFNGEKARNRSGRGRNIARGWRAFRVHRFHHSSNFGGFRSVQQIKDHVDRHPDTKTKWGSILTRWAHRLDPGDDAGEVNGRCASHYSAARRVRWTTDKNGSAAVALKRRATNKKPFGRHIRARYDPIEHEWRVLTWSDSS